MSDRQEELQKQAQEKLAQASTLLEEAAKLAEEGAFTIDFYEGGTYWPQSMTNPESIREQALEMAESETDGWEDMTAEEREEVVRDICDDPESYGIDTGSPGEYAEPGCWWQPSRNC